MNEVVTRTSRPGAESGTRATVFALGYQGRDLEEILQMVRSYGIEQVLDVREKSLSKKPGFAGLELREALARMAVAYVHLPELGCRSEARHALWRRGEKEPFFEQYRHRLAERPQALAELFRRARSSRSLLLCLERDPSRCHRAVLAERLRGEGFLVQEL